MGENKMNEKNEENKTAAAGKGSSSIWCAFYNGIMFCGTPGDNARTA